MTKQLDQDHVVAVVSGGMDSVTLAHLAYVNGMELTLVGVNYGQRHVRELRCAMKCAARLDAAYHEVDLSSVTGLLSGSALTDPSVPVPEGHYADESMTATVVPNRNATMICVAAAVAVGQGAGQVWVGVHAGDHPIYPDCRPEFIAEMAALLRTATDTDLVLDAPFVHRTKAHICALGDQLGVPWGDTWSCYVGGDEHCGVCGTCVERREAFVLAQVTDPTRYLSTPPLPL